ncbi:MAG: ROK family transcriptional regulator [Henriciella sp.]
MTDNGRRSKKTAVNAAQERARITQSGKTILRLAQRSESITQPEIVRSSGMSQQTVSRLVNSLLSSGALIEGKRSSGGKRGQPSMSVGVSSGYCYSFGVAMMTDSIAVTLMDFSGRALEQVEQPMVAMSKPAVTTFLTQSLRRFCQKRSIPKEKVVGIGVGISGYCLGGEGMYNTPRNLDDWAMVNIAEVLGDALGFEVCVENDANAAAMGEAFVGAGKNYSSLAYIYIAAGIGGGVIIDHELMRGHNGNGGEIGLLLPTSVYPMPQLEMMRQIIIENGVELQGISDMLTRFDINWPGVDEWIARTQGSISLLASSLAAILDPQAIVIGGRIPRDLADKIISHIEIFDDVRRTQPRKLPRLLSSSTVGDACSIGAAALAFNELFFSDR